MSMTDRDRKILTIIVPVVALLAFWFLLLAPKREQAATAGQELAEQERKREDLEAQASKLAGAKATFASDYRDVVRLGKAIPSKVDLPSLIVQLDAAARGTGIKFTKIKTGERDPAAAPAAGGNARAAASASENPQGGGAQSAPGQAAQAANGAKAASESQGADAAATDTSTSASAKQGGLAVGGGAPAAGSPAAPGGSGVPGLDTVPLEFQFDGSFFDLADFFHRLKRFVKVTNKDLRVHGRLMTIDSMKFDSQQSTFPDLAVEVKASVYLSPEKQGATAGATPSGPSTTQAAAPSGGDSSSPTPATPTAVSTP